ncbi:MAG: NADH-quinone oxidoreductase subunit M [Candidatus Eisenbacteria bacterium]
MNIAGIPILTLLVVLPLVGGLIVALLPKSATGMAKHVALLISLAEFALSLPLFFEYKPAGPAFQFLENVPWIEGLGASWHLGIDGVSMLLILLTTALTSIAILASYQAIHTRERAYYLMLLALEGAMIGTFVALDLLVFYIFWEAMLVPMYLLIGVWGGQERIRAAVKFFLYTMAGSVLMLVAILWLYFLHHAQTGIYTTDLLALYQTNVPLGAQTWMFLAFALAFAIKVPMWPFHTWLPLAHVEAPTAGSVILAAVLLKMGCYGFIRFALPLFPNATYAFAGPICALAVIGIIYGALVAMVQPDLKKLVAYSSVSHLGFCMLGLFAFNATGWAGSILQMLNHGITTGALFLLVGVIYERRHTRLITEFGGLWKVIPVFSIVFLVVMLSSIALPGTNGFVGEFLILLGAFQTQRPWAILAATGVILSACYMLWMYQRVVFGPVTNSDNALLKDLTRREVIVFVPLLALIFWMGLFPNPILSRIGPTIDRQLAHIETRRLHLRTVEARQAMGRQGVEPCCPEHGALKAGAR